MMTKRVTLIFILVFFAKAGCFANNWGNAQWIWQLEDGPSNTWVSFRKTVNIDEIPENVNVQIAVDSKYWLWVNGEMVIFEGGFSRGPSQAGVWNRKDSIMPTNSWYETINIKPFLKEGENTIAVLVWYWGRMTHKGTHVDSKKGGLLFYAQIGDQTIVSDDSWKMKQHPGYDNTIPPASSSLVQYPVKFDAQKAMNDWSENAWYTPGFDDTQWRASIEKGAAGEAPWYNLIENYVPRLINHGLVDYENNTSLNVPFVSTGTTYECILPFNKQITPYLEIEAEAGKTITITTDNRLNKITATYITKAGTQAFESFSWMNGHKILYTIPQGVKVKALKYRWMSVGEMSGSWEVSDPFYQRLWEMGNNTLFVCARDNFMDCPDRERALWIGDVADQTGYLFYCMDSAGHRLLKKAILQTVYFSGNKVLGALGPSRVRELVGQSLQFIAQVVWPYYFNTGDIETLEIAYPYVYDYLALFPMGGNGLPVYRKGQSPDSWDWLDWGKEGTIDKEPIQPAYYYQALVEALKMAKTLGKTEHIDFYTGRINSIKANYDKVFWKNGFYSSNTGLFKDDRANALAITSGLAKPENYEAIVKNVLVPNKYCSPHFEWLAEEAMFIAGKYEESLARMKEQYSSQVSSGLSTLYENFPKGGSYNHAWNGSNTVLSKYVAGIKPLDVAWSSYEVSPILVHMISLKTKVPTVKGDILIEANRNDSVFTIDLESPDATTAIVGIQKNGATVLEVKVGEQTIWKDSTFVSGVSGVTFESETDDFLKFKVEPGTWRIQAALYKNDPPKVSFNKPSGDILLTEGYDAFLVDVKATDEEGTIANVQLFVDDWLIGSDDEAPYQWGSNAYENLLGLPIGEYIIKALATDNTGLTSEASFVLTVIDSCAVDSDGDGVSDCEDQCPDDPDHLCGYVAKIPGKIEVEAYSSMSGVSVDASGKVLAYIRDWDWMEYQLTESSAGLYEVNYKVAAASEPILFQLLIDGNPINTINAEPTGSFSTFTLIKDTVLLTTSPQKVGIQSLSSSWNFDWIEFVKLDTVFTGVETINKSIEAFNIFPNPLINNAIIEFRVEKESPVNLSVYNIHGELVDELYHRKTSTGVHRLSWNGSDANSRLLSNGIYFLRLTTKHGATSRKICITG